MRYLIVLVMLFLSVSILSRGYRGKSHYKSHYKKHSTRVSNYSNRAHSHKAKGFSRHAYKMLRSKITYLKTLQASKVISIDPNTGDKVYAYPETTYSFPGTNVTQTKFKRSKFFQKYKIGELANNEVDTIEKNLDSAFTESNTPPILENSCEKAIETRKKLMRKNDKKTEILYLKYRRMCESK
ncbi:MAG: hypothetical protein EBS19_15345 [Spirochaetia bacterium]|nr:hypothetical protein [Spirochaetia bacterium]